MSKKTDGKVTAEEQVRSLAYDWALLEGVVKRLRSISTADSKDGWFSTSSTQILPDPDQSGQPRSKPDWLQERAYIHTALVTARRLDDVLTNVGAKNDDDVRAGELLVRRFEGITSIDKSLRERINKRALHPTSWRDPNDREWPLGAILDWANTEMGHFETELKRKPDLHDAFVAAHEKFRMEHGLTLTRSAGGR